MTLFCVTNDVEDLRSCTIRDQKLSTCEDDTCTGCLARPVEQGLFCYLCVRNSMTP